MSEAGANPTTVCWLELRLIHTPALSPVFTVEATGAEGGTGEAVPLQFKARWNKFNGQQSNQEVENHTAAWQVPECLAVTE